MSKVIFTRYVVYELYGGKPERVPIGPGKDGAFLTEEDAHFALINYLEKYSESGWHFIRKEYKRGTYV